MKNISILIPTYNCNCVALVTVLQQQAAKAGIKYEVIVADDGSTDATVVCSNRAINALPGCRYVERPTNAGRAAIRNFLAMEASLPWLLFIDSDMVVRNADYLLSYADTPFDTVVDGGITISGNAQLLRNNLRYQYERRLAWRNAAGQREQHPYQDFHTANFLIRRELMTQHPFDMRFRQYGYEDVLLGKQLQQHHIAIHHIDNPVSFEEFEDNAHFLAKTEEGLRTLHKFRDELKGYSRLLDLSGKLHKWPLRLAYRILGGPLRRYLTHKANTTLFALYRLMYFATIVE